MYKTAVILLPDFKFRFLSVILQSDKKLSYLWLNTQRIRLCIRSLALLHPCS